MHLNINMSNLVKITSKEIQEERLNICKSCSEFKPKLKVCGQCGCFMEMKVKFSRTTCPLKKWDVV
jgi:topoisomerase IA-like protein